MRISYLLIAFGDSSNFQVLYKFMDQLCERGHEVFAITPTERIQWQPNHSKTILQGIVASHPKNVTDYLSWLIQGLLHHWIPSDITISTFCNTSYANYALMDQTVPVYQMQDYEELFMETEELSKLARLTYFLPLVLVANSTWLQNQIRTRVGKEPYLLNPGVDLNLFSPRDSVSNKYSNPSKTIVLSHYSSIKSKGWDDAVEAMRLVFKKLGPHRAEWMVLGNTPSVKLDLPVQFIGNASGSFLAELYSKAHLYFANSWHDSFPLSPLEAMACGTAVVTTPYGTEDYAVNEENSLVIPPGKPELLANAILRIAESPNLAFKLAEGGLSTAPRFTWDLATTRLEQILIEAQNYSPGKKFADLPDLVARAKAKP